MKHTYNSRPGVYPKFPDVPVISPMLDYLVHIKKMPPNGGTELLCRCIGLADAPIHMRSTAPTPKNSLSYSGLAVTNAFIVHSGSLKALKSDKTIVVQRDSDEFGFRIHGSKPVVVTVIEPNTPAESSGLEVGDIIISVNGVNVLDRSHSDVVQIAHAGSDTLTLEVARTSYALNSAKELSDSYTLYSGYLWKMSGYAKGNTTNKWTRRWFCLKKDNCLYYYKTDSDKQPVGVVMLFDQEIRELDTDTELSKPNKFVIQKEEAVPLYLAADTLEARSRWGYRVQQSSSSKKHSFEIVPPDPTKKHYYFHAESDTDRRRWISALEYSIERWLVQQ
ncbi:hypothetical protein D910_03475 [Dendroctonus ponderosae]|uniref:PDZ domain-containing protein n=1 Tax=Dendroctonus ponderosae TaxID=77166 RepID=U4U615_DENPD|nr:hypothetical protein D910_03475 [Dendroctonus ponderosae]